MKNSGNFTRIKRFMVGISGVALSVCSIILSKQGVGITGELAWMGTIIALSLFCAELMFNSSFEELNWTMLFLGLGAYLYSIWTNVEGFYYYRQIEGNLWTHFDTTNLFGGLFMDIYPELAIAWALGESKIGDLIGNTVKTIMNPDKLTEPFSTPKQPQQQSQPQKPPQEQDVPPFLDNRREEKSEEQVKAELYQRLQASNNGHPSANRNQAQNPNINRKS